MLANEVKLAIKDVGKALGKTGIPKRMLANEVKLAIKDVGKALVKAGIPKRLTMRSIGNPKACFRKLGGFGKIEIIELNLSFWIKFRRYTLIKVEGKIVVKNLVSFVMKVGLKSLSWVGIAYTVYNLTMCLVEADND